MVDIIWTEYWNRFVQDSGVVSSISNKYFKTNINFQNIYRVIYLAYHNVINKAFIRSLASIATVSMKWTSPRGIYEIVEYILWQKLLNNIIHFFNFYLIVPGPDNACGVLFCNFQNIILISPLFTIILLLLAMAVNWTTFNIFQSILKTIFESCAVEICSVVLAWLTFVTTHKSGALETHYLWWLLWADS